MKTVTGALVITLVGAVLGSSVAIEAASGGNQARAQAAGAGQDPAATAPPTRGGGQRGGGRGAAAELPNTDGLSVAQVEGLFDAYVVMQARNILRLSDEQFLTFGARINRLQMLRRRIQRQRQEQIRELRGLLGATGTFDEATAAARIKALDDILAQAGEQIRQAYVEIDQVLTPRQRAQFRVLEENMERQKLAMLARAQQQARTPDKRPGG